MKNCLSERKSFITWTQSFGKKADSVRSNTCWELELGPWAPRCPVRASMPARVQCPQCVNWRSCCLHLLSLEPPCMRLSDQTAPTAPTAPTTTFSNKQLPLATWISTRHSPIRIGPSRCHRHPAASNPPSLNTRASSTHPQASIHPPLARGQTTSAKNRTTRTSLQALPRWVRTPRSGPIRFGLHLKQMPLKSKTMTTSRIPKTCSRMKRSDSWPARHVPPRRRYCPRA